METYVKIMHDAVDGVIGTGDKYRLKDGYIYWYNGDTWTNICIKTKITADLYLTFCKLCKMQGLEKVSHMDICNCLYFISESQNHKATDVIRFMLLGRLLEKSMYIGQPNSACINFKNGILDLTTLTPDNAHNCLRLREYTDWVTADMVINKDLDGYFYYEEIFDGDVELDMIIDSTECLTCKSYWTFQDYANIFYTMDLSKITNGFVYALAVRISRNIPHSFTKTLNTSISSSD